MRPVPRSPPRAADRWAGRLLGLAASPWSLSLELLGAFGGEAPLRRPEARDFRLRPGDPLDLVLATLHAGAVAGSRLPAVGVGARELGNKVRAFAHFHDGRRGEAGDRPGLDAYDALWLEEGTGYALALRHRGDPGALRRAVAAAPPALRVVRASGVGLALAVERVAAAGKEPAGWAGRFAAAVEAAVEPRHRTAALENLGLAVRTLRPERLAAAGAAAHDAGFGGPFWHGAGRGLYFAPTQAVPCPGGSGLERAYAEAPAEGRPDSVAGWAWALTLVNVRHPRVAARRLAALGEAGPLAAALPWAAQGLAAALTLWRTATGDAATAERFLAGPLPAALGAAVLDALGQAGPQPVPEERLAGLFRYRPIPGRDDGRA